MPVPVATISSSDGQVLDPNVALMSLEVHRELNRVPEAKLTVRDGSIAARRFELSNSTFFQPGTVLGIALRREGDVADTSVFEGAVVRHSVGVGPEGSTLHVELKDLAFKLTRARKSAAFRSQTDDGAIRKLVTDAGLAVGELASTTPEHEELVQYYCSDWDFILSRADVNGLVVDVDRGALSMRPLELAEPAHLELEYGMSSILELELDIDAAHQLAGVSSVGWDIGQQALTDPQDAKAPNVAVGNLDVPAIATALGGASYTLLHAASVAPEELAAWANGRLARSRFAMLQGRVVIEGNAALAPLNTVQLAGVSERFNGKALVSAVIHRLDEDGWTTELRLGLSPEWFARQPDIADVPAGGLLPPVANLQIGKVAAFESDPRTEHRVKVKLPALDDEQGFVWARVARLDAGSERGSAFWPGADDEVVVGFLAGDPRQAIILGSLYSSANPPPSFVGAPSEDNHRRALVSRGGSLIGFDDEKNVIVVTTPAANVIELDDDARSIKLVDQHGNRIVMNEEGITLQATKVTIDSSGAVTIKGSSVDVQ